MWVGGEAGQVPMPDEHSVHILSDSHNGELLCRTILRPAGFAVSLVGQREQAETLLAERLPDLLVIEDQFAGGKGSELGSQLLEQYPALPVILLSSAPSDTQARQTLRLGFAGCLYPPLRGQEVLQTLQAVLQRQKRLKEWVIAETRRNTGSLQKQLDGLEALQEIGRKVTSLLDLDNVLSAVVGAAVDLTGAEEGSLLLLDEASGELYMRAARNFQEDFVRTFRLPVQESLPGQVLLNARPVVLDQSTPKKIKTAYLVSSLMYVPMLLKDRAIGVLGVDNRRSGHPFNDAQLAVMAALADYAAIAIENARLYEHSEVERKKLETILSSVGDGVLVVDNENNLLLINQAARQAFGVGEPDVTGMPVQEVIHQPELLDLLSEEHENASLQTEISLLDGRVLNAHITAIPEIGLAVTTQDITHLKELDRIKSDFVNTVSHDLRSPLTAILGYVELIERVGFVNAQQSEFIRRIQLSVQNITALINDLLDLGRLEAGFDARKDLVPLAAIILYAVEGFKGRAVQKEQTIEVDVPANLPQVLGSPIRLRQMITNLIGNAIKYTPAGGKIQVTARAEENQFIFQVSDDGPGIPSADQPYIFDKFYRAGNVSAEEPGTGLGLAIVKSIVDSHQGRIWVDSILGQGSTFTVVLPVADVDL
jgi:two-component system phosphate regulon sensor histidine kinase PhoR